MNTLAVYLEKKFAQEDVIFLAMPLEESKVFQNLIKSYKEFYAGSRENVDEWTSKLFQAREESRYAHDVFLFMAMKGPKSVRLKGDFLDDSRSMLKYMLFPAHKSSKYTSIFESEPNESFINLWKMFAH